MSADEAPRPLDTPPLPRTPAEPPVRGRVLVLAPHPDDETVGLGGTLALHVRAGDPVGVTFMLGKRRVEAVGSVRFVAQVADAASDTRRVVVEIPNDEQLPAGTRVLIEFAPGAERD